VCALILVALLRKSPLNYGELSTIRQALPDEKESKKMKRRALFLLMATALSCSLAWADGTGSTASSRHISLREAVQLALKHNHNVRIAGYAVDEKQHAKEAAKGFLFPIDTQ